MSTETQQFNLSRKIGLKIINLNETMNDFYPTIFD